MSTLRFKDGKFRILQMSDVQDMQWMRPAMRRMMESACDKLNPDLIVYTGDNILGNHMCDGRFFGVHDYDHDKQYDIIKRSLDLVFTIPEERGIPFAVIYGNHDDRNALTKDEQADIICSYFCNRGFEKRGELVGNYTLEIKDEDGVKLVLYMIDTSRWDRENDRSDDTITPAQVAWFREETQKYKGVPGIVYMHIPMKQVAELTEVLPDGSVFLTPDAEGIVGEQVSALDGDSGFFEAIKDSGDIIAVVSGHDHLNDFEGVVDGVRFIASPACSFRCYGSDRRGMTLFEFDAENPAKFTHRVVRYPELCGNGLGAKLRYLLDADELVPQKTAFIAAASVLGAAALTCSVFAVKKAVRR